MTETRRWRFKGPEMEGPIARWYARVRGSQSQLDAYRKQAFQLTAGLRDGARVLEVAPGPGYLAIEMARPGRLQVTGLDISRTFVEIAAENARNIGVSVEFRQGDVAQMPFETDSFDLIVCQAAFKNFTLPHRAIAEMYRVLCAGGTAVIQDMSKDATHADIEREVNEMDLGRISTFTTKATLEMLKRRAYAPSQFERLATDSPFKTCEISTEGIGLEVRLKKESR
ncbi:MAG: class I SAM-dependent methyltransferase [Chloroflexi bacterium]|nr:MAG: class I SAM-dependent methyltransferase [Chloroflexota bacterium]TME40656.1 MAG: class I SAM-dependent methyltransferase [Chloroflexota bacterium]TME53452.1 MAG: class I SAM-dependent methyltransferase [Chloroflexota bacterium]